MASPADKVRRQLQRIGFLRATGPVSYDYGQWVDSTHQTLITLFGEDSPAAHGLLEIVGEGAEARGWGLPLAPGNPWGMQARLGRAEAYLQRLLAKLDQQSGLK
ncbi:MAG: hypothetical protein ACE5IZ_11700 [Dehalococcoidia bacterium]